MPGRSCEFFADERDLLTLLEAFKELGNYKYIQLRSELNKENLIFDDPVELLPFAVVSVDAPVRVTSFLVLENTQEVFSGEIKMRDDSGIKKIAGQARNPNSITFAFGGDAGDNTLIMSDIATIGDTDKAIEIHKHFKKVVMSKTKRLGTKGRPYRLMSGAIEKLKSGWRLTSGKGWARNMDLNLPVEEWAKLEV